VSVTASTSASIQNLGGSQSGKPCPRLDASGCCPPSDAKDDQTVGTAAPRWERARPVPPGSCVLVVAAVGSDGGDVTVSRSHTVSVTHGAAGCDDDDEKRAVVVRVSICGDRRMVDLMVGEKDVISLLPLIIAMDASIISLCCITLIAAIVMVVVVVYM